jgi:hypothetical protein
MCVEHFHDGVDQAVDLFEANLKDDVVIIGEVTVFEEGYLESGLSWKDLRIVVVLIR